MKLTLSVIKADIGSIGGHIGPSRNLLDAVKALVAERGRGCLVDRAVSSTGDDIAILMTHRHGVGSPIVHGLAWEAFVCGAQIAKEQGLYGAGQDLLMLPMGELEYPGITDKLAILDKAFKSRPGVIRADAA
jgi:fructose 1,6-bisphosphate aldolase/phosphatase